MMRPAAACALILLAAGCSTPELTRESLGDLAPFPPAPEAVRFLAFGDYGFANDAQNRTAQGMERVCAREGCDLALLLGDNVYPSAPDDARHPAFRHAFEEPYRNLSFPFYVALGNHDVMNERNGSALLDYANASDRWRMPARSYAFSEGPVFFVALDLTPFTRDETLTADARALLAWLDEVTVSRAFQDASWRVAFAHFPYESSGKHGDSVGAVREVIERAVCGAFDLYLAGHDHSLEWAAPDPACPRTELIVSGAAGEARTLRDDSEALFQHDASTGFFWFEATQRRLTVRAFDGDGRELFERSLTPEARWEAPSSLQLPPAQT